MAGSKKATEPVTIEGGQISGIYEDNGQVAVFKGIPYAKPPIGDLRWKPPLPVEQWDGIKAAKSFGPMALQLGIVIKTFFYGMVEGQGWGVIRTFGTKLLFLLMPMPRQDEDCLYLNIRTATLDKEAKLPVMLWIHGGDHTDGSGSDVPYNSNALVHKGVVVVTINYRLGLMGYFAHPELSRESEKGVSGNYGTMDQIAALRWVQDNIKAFGGDPDNVTIFGESAGGESVAHMMSSLLARDLFHKAIMQSPANGGQMIHLKQPFLHHKPLEEAGKAFADRMVGPGENQLKDMRLIPAKKLYQILRKEKELNTFYPVIDGYVLQKSPFETFLDGEHATVPLLVGSNSDEGTLFYPIIKKPLAEFVNRVIELGKMPDLLREEFGEDADVLLDLYPGLENGKEEAESSMLGDSIFGSKARFYAVQASKAGQPVYLYFFSRTPPSPKQTAGAFHGAEIPFVHGKSNIILPLYEKDLGLSRIMIDYWTQFAKTGNPNVSPHPGWPLFDFEDQKYMELGARIGEAPIARAAKYDILDRHLLRQIEKMKELRR